MHLNDALRTANMTFIFKYCKFKNVSEAPSRKRKEKNWSKKDLLQHGEWGIQQQTSAQTVLWDKNPELTDLQ